MSDPLLKIGLADGGFVIVDRAEYQDQCYDIGACVNDSDARVIAIASFDADGRVTSHPETLDILADIQAFLAWDLKTATESAIHFEAVVDAMKKVQP